MNKVTNINTVNNYANGKNSSKRWTKPFQIAFA